MAKETEVTTYVLSFCKSEEARDLDAIVYADMVRPYWLFGCVKAINERLRELSKTPLGVLDPFLPGKSAGPALWGAVIDDLPFETMARLVVEQPWHLKECVQLYVQKQTERGNPEEGVVLEREGECQLQTWTYGDLKRWLLDKD